MAQVHPLLPLVESSASCSSSSTSSYITSKKETFTIWMKSLVMHANGCTVYNEDGEIVYRVDNYDRKGSNEVHLMDLEGKVIFTVLKRKKWIFKQWRGYKCDGLKLKTQKPFFQAGRRCATFVAQDGCYKLEALSGKSAFKITNGNGGLVAEAKRKLSSSGVLLGDDVLTLVVEPEVDHSFIMALVTVHGLMLNRL